MQAVLHRELDSFSHQIHAKMVKCREFRHKIDFIHGLHLQGFNPCKNPRIFFVAMECQYSLLLYN